jgi:hypothetical protein
MRRGRAPTYCMSVLSQNVNALGMSCSCDGYAPKQFKLLSAKIMIDLPVPALVVWLAVWSGLSIVGSWTSVAEQIFMSDKPELVVRLRSFCHSGPHIRAGLGPCQRQTFLLHAYVRAPLHRHCHIKYEASALRLHRARTGFQRAAFWSHKDAVVFKHGVYRVGSSPTLLRLYWGAHQTGRQVFNDNHREQAMLRDEGALSTQDSHD